MAIRLSQSVAIPLPKAAFAPPGRATLAVPYVRQTEDNWCWAACGEMLFRHRGDSDKTQCSLASDEFDLVCCPSPGAPSDCDVGCWPQDSYPDHGMAVNVHDRSLSADEVRAELDAGRPVQVCYNWAGSDSTHVALITGERGDGKFQVLDPSPKTSGTGARDFDFIESAYGKGTWMMSFTF